MKSKIFTAILFFILSFECYGQNIQLKIEQWSVFQLDLSGPSSGNPYMEVDLSAIFKKGSQRIEVPGFYDGNGLYRIRFSPPSQGKWAYQTKSNIPTLAGKKGQFLCVPPTDKNHGPVHIVDTFHLQYADSVPSYAVGTTAYQWTSVKQSIQEKTLKTLLDAPFNKIRMCVFPKSYIYGNQSEPWRYPYKRQGDVNDFTQPDYLFFQNIDQRIKQLLDMEIQADVILFHPYDIWGYCKMGKEFNERYVRYMIARISAYRNVWWSLANEWDVPEIKNTIDWQGIGILLQTSDPHKRLRGIHNWYDSEDHFYDHSKPWITHVSAQTSQFYNAIKWRNQYHKPLLFDEMRYEGDVPSGWGNLTGQEMASYFWMAGLSGGYPTHGETFTNPADDSTEVRWWAKGGTLVGDSPERIKYFRSVMEQAPINEMSPSIVHQSDPKNLQSNVYILSKPGKFYLVYIPEKDQTIEIDLTGTTPYKMDILDTWNMSMVEHRSAIPGAFKYKSILPFTALKIYID